MAKEITEAMCLVEERWKGDEQILKNVRPDQAVVAAAIVGGIQTFLPLIKIVESPFFDRSGRLVCTPGYDRETAIWYEPFDESLKIDLNPSQKKVDKAMKFLWEEFFCEFAFADQTAIAHSFCALFQPFISEFIASPAPAYLFSANRSGSGKTYLADCIARVFSARGAHNVPESAKNEEEVRKNLDAGLLQGRMAIILDNIETRMRWPWFQGYLTSPVINPRTLGKSETTAIINRHWWAITANTPILYVDTVRRTVPIKLQLNLEDPSDRTFKREDLQAWVDENRSKLITCCVTILQGWIKAGRKLSGHSLTSFSRWAKVMGGICQWLELPGFLETQKTHMTEVNEEATERREILDELHRKHGDISQADYKFFLDSLAESDLIPRKFDGKDPYTHRRAFGMWLTGTWNQHPICSGYHLTYKRCKILNKNVFSLRKIGEQDVNSLRNLTGTLDRNRFRWEEPKKDGKLVQHQSHRNPEPNTPGSGEVPVEVPVTKNVENTSFENNLPEPRNLISKPREIYKNTPNAPNTLKNAQVSPVNKLRRGDIGDQVPGSGNPKKIQSNTKPPDLDPDDPRVVQRIKQLEKAIQTRKTVGPKKLLTKLQRELAEWKSRIKPRTSTPPPGGAPPDPAEIAREDQKVIDSGEFGDLIGEAMF